MQTHTVSGDWGPIHLFLGRRPNGVLLGTWAGWDYQRAARSGWVGSLRDHPRLQALLEEYRKDVEH